MKPSRLILSFLVLLFFSTVALGGYYYGQDWTHLLFYQKAFVSFFTLVTSLASIAGICCVIVLTILLIEQADQEYEKTKKK